MANTPGDPRRTRRWQHQAHRTIANSNGTCAWCHQPIDRTLSGNHPDGPTVDHTIALEDGGPMWDPANHTVMHKRCNSTKEGARRKQQALAASTDW